MFFASDFHLGVDAVLSSLEREKKVVAWLETIRHEAAVIYLLGDIFDFWFEYATAVPRGQVRLLGKLAQLADEGTELHFFTGNHDMWVFDYLSGEIGLKVHRKALLTEISGKRFYLAHGDGIGPGDHKYKFIKRVFANPFCQWLFARLHPNFGIGLARYFSHKSRLATEEEVFYGEKEWQVIHSRQMLEKHGDIDFFIYGHRHLPNDIPLTGNSRFINLGDWVSHFTYAVFDGQDLSLEKFDS